MALTQTGRGRVHQGHLGSRAVAARQGAREGARRLGRGGHADGRGGRRRGRRRAAAPVEEKTEFTAMLTEVGSNKINVIKVVREVTSLGPEGSQGSRRGRAQADQGRRPQGRGRGDQEEVRGSRRQGRDQVSARLTPRAAVGARESGFGTRKIPRPSPGPAAVFGCLNKHGLAIPEPRAADPDPGRNSPRMYSLPKNVYRERIDFSKIKTTIPIPNLIEIQKKSYERFLQMNRLPSEREDAGLQSVFKSVFPISDFRENSSLEFIEYSIGNWECKCGRLAGLHHLRKPCANCGAHARRRSVRRARSAVPALRQAQRGARRRLRHLRQHRRPEAQVRRRRVPGARHDLRRAAQGHDPPRRLEQGPRDRRQDHPRHQGAGGLLRRHPADDRQRHVHHQRHRARHRLAAAPLAGRVLPLGRQDALHRADHPVSRIVGGVRVRHEEPALRPHRPQAEVPRDGVPARPRPARRRRDHPDLLHGRAAAPRGRHDLWAVERQPAGPARRPRTSTVGRRRAHPRRQEDHANGLAALKKAGVAGGRDRRRRARRRVRRGRRRRSVDGRGDPRGQRGARRRA